jgi:serine/threonine-protein kinase
MSEPNVDKPKKELPSIGGDYTLVEKLGEGAFGEVYRAKHELLGQEFAVKLLRPELSEDQDVRDRFLDEARALIRFSHRNVVQVRHVGEHNGRLYLVMDLIRGVELTELMKRDGAFEEKRAVAICRQVLAGLEAAHAAGIVHRDLKPSNMLVEMRQDGTEHVMILDFGLSKFSAIDGEKGAHRSITGTIVGTLAYMSPEQIKGDKDIDGRSDLFAAGLILQEMLQGHHPYPGDSGIVVAAKLLRDPIPPIEEKRASQISLVTRSALARALERDRDARFASVTAFAQALEGKGPPSDTSRVTTIQDTAAELARQEAAAKQAAGGKGATKEKKSLAPLLVTVVLLGAAGAAFVVMNQGGDEPGPGVLTADRDAQPGDGDRGAQADPGGAGPAPLGATDPEPADPEPADPEPTDPAPTDPADPTATDPAAGATDPEPGPDPEPTGAGGTSPEAPSGGAGTDPAEPAGAEPDPDAPEAPEQPDRPVDPAPVVEPPPTQPTPVDPPESAVSPEACCDEAGPLLGAGRWAEARKLYVQAAEKSDLTEPVQVAALRGAGKSAIAQADALARSGKLPEALELLRNTVGWLGKRYAAYEKVPQASTTVRLQLGFARLHMAEALVEMARWAALSGDRTAAGKALARAGDHYEFARHQLERDGVRYWEFLIRRAQYHRLKGDSENMIADVAHTTKTNNVEVPAHMWVAHATAARRVAEAWAAQGNAAQAYQWAQKASKVAEDGASWQEDKLSRQQWLDLGRVLFVQAVQLPAGENPNALHGKLRYWVSMAEKQPLNPWVAPEVDAARLLTAKAMVDYLAGLKAALQGNAGAKGTALTAALEQVDRAIAMLRQVAAGGGVLEDPLPYEVKAAVLTAAGRGSEATAATQAARKAGQRNPD